MPDMDELLYEAQKRGVLQPLKVLIKGTEELTDWQPKIGKLADYITYSEPQSKRRMVKYGRGGFDRPLDANVNMRNNQFGSIFGATADEVYRRLDEYFPSDASRGYGTQGEYYVPIGDGTDAGKFLEFLKSFLDRVEA